MLIVLVNNLQCYQKSEGSPAQFLLLDTHDTVIEADPPVSIKHRMSEDTDSALLLVSTNDIHTNIPKTILMTSYTAVLYVR